MVHHFGETDTQSARSGLTEALLIAAVTEPSGDIDNLKNALQILALTYRSRWPS
jgi:hypothetical protein